VVQQLHQEWWEARIARQREIDASIAAKAEYEYLYDKPYEDKKKVRVAGPFTVESLSPHRMLSVDENDDLIDTLKEDKSEYAAKQSFPQMILDNLKTAGVQQAHKDDRITFTALTPWPGDLICGDGRYLEGETEKRAAIFIGPEFGTVQRADLVAAAREAGDADFDVLIARAFRDTGQRHWSVVSCPWSVGSRHPPFIDHCGCNCPHLARLPREHVDRPEKHKNLR